MSSCTGDERNKDNMCPFKIQGGLGKDLLIDGGDYIHICMFSTYKFTIQDSTTHKLT